MKARIPEAKDTDSVIVAYTINSAGVPLLVVGKRNFGNRGATNIVKAFEDKEAAELWHKLTGTDKEEL